ncbi:transposase family protein [Micromonospora sp. WMMA1363]|uniref:transposase family protein n=1 Tax=Micromonospora sp. WMMA1363 TaxID=3053985 RepID=UPI00259D22A4|nr:transposase family protein [Micromonospora sp. WMMA1363]MDM4723163.1 transposase family protein [Micromonospora sp. WMMA1363]MDM4723165.1 transposase family protein [Micromonospora sp. WMMA1363]
MYHTTGLTRNQIRDLCILVNAAAEGADAKPWPPILGLYRSVVVTLTYMRRNRVQAEIAESFGVSQSTISRAIARVTPLIKRALTECVPVAGDLSPHVQYVVDGTLLPCWSWRSCKELFSGKHKITGMSVQVCCTLDGRLVWISDPVTGNRHDSHSINESGALVTLDPANWVGDKGYVGNDMITPYKKPQGGELTEWQKEYNHQVNRIRWIVEQVIANFKTWRIMHTDYRRPLETFTETISCVIGLHFYRMLAE